MRSWSEIAAAILEPNKLILTPSSNVFKAQSRPIKSTKYEGQIDGVCWLEYFNGVPRIFKLRGGEGEQNVRGKTISARSHSRRTIFFFLNTYMSYQCVSQILEIRNQEMIYIGLPKDDTSLSNAPHHHICICIKLSLKPYPKMLIQIKTKYMLEF